MALDNYDPSTALTAYYPTRDERRPARLWATEKLLHDMAELGMIEFFEGPGTDPSGISGFATNKLWLRVSSGVTEAPGEIRGYDGSGDPTLLSSWPEVVPPAGLSFLGASGPGVSLVTSASYAEMRGLLGATLFSGATATTNINANGFGLGNAIYLSGNVWGAGSITTGDLSVGGSSFVAVIPASPETVTSISGTAPGIPMLFVRNASGTHSITITHGSDAIRCPGAVNAVIAPLECALFIRVNSTIWQMLGASSGGASTFTNQNGSDYVARALDNVIGEGNTRLRDVVGDGATPTATQWRQAVQKAHDDLRATGGTVWFSEPITFDTTPVLWDGYVSLRGTGYAVTHRFAQPEPHTGAVILGPSGQSLGDEDFGWGGGYDQPNGLINIKLDATILPNSTTRPRAHVIFENFGILGNSMTYGHGIRVVGTMYVNLRNLSLAWLPHWGIYSGSRGDMSPGSANGCRFEDLLITSCGSAGSGATGGLNWQCPDAYFSKIQSGGNFGMGVRMSAGNISLDQVHSWNNAEDNIRFTGCANVRADVLSYDGDKTLVAVLGSRNVALSGVLWHPNRKGNTAERDTSSLYLDSTSTEITIGALRASGETHGIRYSQYTAWGTGQSITAGQYRVNANKRYLAATSGTTGSTAPTHTSGTVSDGGVDWTFVNGYGLYGLYQLGGASDITVEGASFKNHRTRDYQMQTANAHGSWAGKAHAFPTLATPSALFSVADEDSVWRVMCTRLGSNQDAVIATVIGGASPAIIGKDTSGSTIDLAISGTTLQVTSTSTVTVLATWERIR